VLALGLAACGDDGDSGGTTEAPKAKAEFSYSGKTGPANWGSLDPAYAECSEGRRQSPIALEEGEQARLPKIDVAYRAAETEAENNGHSVEVGYPPGSSITIDGRRSELEQFHYHAPAEHTINGRRYPLEFHFVNTDENHRTTALGVFVKQGRENPAFAKLVKALPEKKGETADVEVDAAELLPRGASTAARWSYSGSLTTPPCTEGVSWYVYSEPIELSADQIAAYRTVYDDNDRPLQKLNGRTVLVGR
jgi:carbonic anhydrase